MLSSKLRSVLLLLAVQHVAIGCATDADDAPDQLDQDGEGKGDGISSEDPSRLIDAPFYFSVPRGAVTTTLNRPAYPYPTLWNDSVESKEVGLRVIAIKQGIGLDARKTARREMAAKLARAGVLQDGDIVLTFRPELAGTMAYPHIQMGTTHAGLVYTEGGVAFNIDSPLDSEYVGQFDTSHYAGNGGTDAGTDALHIIRPRITDARRVQLRRWVGDLKSGLPRINGNRQQIKFQSDYLVPSYVSAHMTTRQTVTTLGKIILETDTTTKLPMYCSEFAWHMLALSSCTAADIRNAPASGAPCVDEVFAPMPLVAKNADEVGMAEGPLVSLMATPPAGRAALIAKIFATGNATKLSAGHRAVSEQVAPLMGPLSQFYGARAQGLSVEDTAPVAEMLSANMPNNYSPTTFLVQAMGDTAKRATDYVATVAFVNGGGYAKAQRLAQNPVP
jgi:hypothetical protein